MIASPQRKTISAVFIALFLPLLCTAQVPSSFRWVDFKSEPSVVSKVNGLLTQESFTAIREIGIIDDDAIVFVTLRDTDPQVQMPDYDVWTIYNLSLKTTKYTKLVVGYKVRIASWLRTNSGQKSDLGISYLDCYECEAASIFTAFHYDRINGWQARWPDSKNPGQPGIALFIGDAGEPFTDEAVDQVWAVIAPTNDAYFIGTWYHARDLSSGKISDAAVKYYVDSRGVETREQIVGSNLSLFKRALCNPEYGVDELVGGQETDSCKVHMKKHEAK